MLPYFMEEFSYLIFLVLKRKTNKEGNKNPNKN